MTTSAGRSAQKRGNEASKTFGAPASLAVTPPWVAWPDGRRVQQMPPGIHLFNGKSISVESKFA